MAYEISEQPLYAQDNLLVSMVREHGAVAIDNIGRIHTSINVFDASLTPILERLKKSAEAFDGRFIGVTPKIVPTSQEKINTHLQGLLMSFDETKAETVQSNAASYVRNLHLEALEVGASDIHISIRENKTVILFRIDGDLTFVREQSYNYGVELATYAARNLGKLTQYSVNADKADAQYKLPLPQDVTELDEKGNKVTIKKVQETAWRFSQVPTTYTSKIVIRKLSAANGVVQSLPELGLEQGHINLIERIVVGQGGVFVTGPTGSGKTTLINAILQLVPTTRVIHTLEDPPEWPMQRVNESQTAIDELFQDEKGNKPRSFRARGVQMLRQDTDVVFYGEVREEETAKNYFRLCETGQLCVGTLHTNGSISSVSTLTEQLGISKYQASAPGALKALCHTRLAKTLCPNEGCTISHAEAVTQTEEGTEDWSNKLDKIARLGIDTSKVRFPVKGNNSCEHCRGKGEKGRSALFEIVVIDSKARHFIQSNDLEGWLTHLGQIGWKSIAEHGRIKIERGLMDVDAVAGQVDTLFDLTSEDIYTSLLDSKVDLKEVDEC